LAEAVRARFRTAARVRPGVGRGRPEPGTRGVRSGFLRERGERRAMRARLRERAWPIKDRR
jgi:hypothetical protein